MKKLARLTAIGASVVTAGCLTVGAGVVSADSITNTGPNSYNAILARTNNSSLVTNTNSVNFHNSNNQTATTGSAMVSGNTSHGGNDYQPAHEYQYSDWDAWSPYVWQQSGRNYNDWYMQMMNHVRNVAWSGGYGMPSAGSSNWSSWNPMMWQQYGSSYGNWYRKFSQYLNNNCMYWQRSWPSSQRYSNNISHNQYQPMAYNRQSQYPAANLHDNNTHAVMNAVSGNASNNNIAAANIDVTNNVPLTSVVTNQAHQPSNIIYMTGPHSFNTIREITDTTTRIMNTNNIDITNTNDQTAITGNASVSDNTHGGMAQSGDATNNNTTDFSLDITNN